MSQSASNELFIGTVWTKVEVSFEHVSGGHHVVVEPNKLCLRGIKLRRMDTLHV